MGLSIDNWESLIKNLEKSFGKKPDTNGILFLIGIQELGDGFSDFSKEQKEDLMHIGTCKIFSFSGYYLLIGKDEDGWPVWENKKKLPVLSTDEQENFIKYHIIEYFSDIYDLN